MPRDVSLQDVTEDNWEDVADLEVNDKQEDFVASNVYSIAESKFNPEARPRAIYAGKTVVGFMMYEPLAAEGEPEVATIYRFMIDKKHQGKGYGRAAIEKAVEEIRAIQGVKKISICYMPGNPVKKLYASVGFVEIGRDEDGEIIAELAL